jgi:hypothetical protein
MSHATDPLGGVRHAGIYVGKILKGAKPGDLPIEQASKFIRKLQSLASACRLPCWHWPTRSSNRPAHFRLWHEAADPRRLLSGRYRGESGRGADSPIRSQMTRLKTFANFSYCSSEALSKH